MNGNTNISVNERNWAAIAHASTLLSIVVGLVSAGLGSILLALVPLGIYLAYRDRSRYVAFHALQATTLQLAGLIVYALGLTALLVATVVAWVVSGLLSVVLIGIFLIPVALLVTLLFVLYLLLFPLLLMGYALYAAVETGRGINFRYPWIGDWLDDTEASWHQISIQ
jgi:uncharacterized Tic20 family protein